MNFSSTPSHPAMASGIASSSAGNTHTLNTLTAKLKTLINNDLRAICRNEGLPTSGVKGVLQERIIKYLQNLAASNNAEALTRMQQRIYNGGNVPPAFQFTSPGPASSGRPTLPPLNPHATMPSNYRPNQTHGVNNVPKFRENPFFEILEPISRPVHLPIMQSSRHTVTLLLKLPEDLCQRIRGDNSIRVCLFSVQEPHMGPHGRNDIAFPAQIEVRINNQEFRANFKGLKNKPGSTRPADITAFLKKQAMYSNSVQIIYAMTTRKFQIVAMLVKKRTIDSLVERIRSHGVITKVQVLGEMRANANDPDIVATSHVMSLKDPLSMSRIQLACRSTVCTHNQCFDAACFLQLQEQAPTWTCPICSKVTSFDGIVVDQYFQEILQKSPKSVEQVTIEPNGEWHVAGDPNVKEDKSNGYHPNNAAGDDSDDDLIEITDPRTKAIKQEAPVTPYSLNTPSIGSREQSVATPASRTQAGQKRKSEVIDLTLSDDDEPPRPNKRQETYNTPNSLADRRGNNGYQVLQQSNVFRAPSTNGVSFSVRPPSLTSLPVSANHINSNGNNSINISLRSPGIQPTNFNVSPSPYSPNQTHTPSFGHREAFAPLQQQSLQAPRTFPRVTPEDHRRGSFSQTYNNTDTTSSYNNSQMYLQNPTVDQSSAERQQWMREFLLRQATKG